MKISFGLVVYHEEHLIERALKSIVGVADEILVVHDGPCSDKTLEIAKKYTDKVWERPRQQGSDPHRIFLLQHAKNDWFFMLDADEFLSEDLKNALIYGKIDLSSCAAVAFKWPLWNGKTYVTKHNWRPALFNKHKSWAVSLHNFSIQSVGRVLYTQYQIEHQPKETKIGFRRLCSKQISDRIQRDAVRFEEGYDSLEKYNEHLIPDDFKRWYVQFLKYPRLYAWWHFLKHFLGSYQHSYKDGRFGFLSSIQLAVYQFRLGYAIAASKKYGNKH